jgi:exonuclease VII small subunit
VSGEGGDEFFSDFLNSLDSNGRLTTIFDDEFASDNRTASQILKTVVSLENELLVFEQQLRALLGGERLTNLLKKELQPVQDRVTSLTIQTSGYEKMDPSR